MTVISSSSLRDGAQGQDEQRRPHGGRPAPPPAPQGGQALTQCGGGSLAMVPAADTRAMDPRLEPPGKARPRSRLCARSSSPGRSAACGRGGFGAHARGRL